MDISLIGNSALRIAIQRNLVSFPSQLPAVIKRPGDDTQHDVQQRVAHLYFSRGWPVRDICARYGLSKPMVQRLISEWRIRAVGAGYIQDIHPEDLYGLIQVKDEAEWPLLNVNDSRRDKTPSPAAQLLPSGGLPVFLQTSL
jgi:Homeodomain-like domain